MLTLEECRSLIESGEMYTDKEIEEIRDTLYGLANLALETWHAKKMQ